MKYSSKCGILLIIRRERTSYDSHMSCTAVAGGNHFLSFSYLAIPWTAVTGMAKKTVRRDAAITTPSL